MRRYALFIGRWRTFHDGHLWLIKQQLNAGIPVLIMIRPTLEDPLPSERYRNIKHRLENEGYFQYQDFTISTLPVDIESINYGRDVGYEVNYWKPPDDIGAITSSKILEEGNDVNR